MKAIGIYENLPLQNEISFVQKDMPTPTLGPRDLLVRVKAVSVNPVDTKVRAGTKPQQDLKVLGWDAAGVVEAVGKDVSLFKVGDEVFYAGSLVRPGTNSELHSVDERIVGKKPKTLSFEQAAALPLTTITAYESLFHRIGIQESDKQPLLIVGAAGGVGSIAIQLAKKLTNLKVIGTASTEASKKWVKDLGADEVVDHTKDIAVQLRDLGLPQVKYVLGLTHTTQHLKTIENVIAPQGHFCLIDDPEALDIRGFKAKSVAVHWEFMFTRSMFETDDMIEQHNLLNKVSELVDRGEIKTTLNKALEGFTVANFKEAHQLLESGRSVGKVVIKF